MISAVCCLRPEVSSPRSALRPPIQVAYFAGQVIGQNVVGGPPLPVAFGSCWGVHSRSVVEAQEVLQRRRKSCRGAGSPAEAQEVLQRRRKSKHRPRFPGCCDQGPGRIQAILVEVRAGEHPLVCSRRFELPDRRVVVVSSRVSDTMDRITVWQERMFGISFEGILDKSHAGKSKGIAQFGHLGAQVPEVLGDQR